MAGYNKTTRSLDESEYKSIMQTILNGFTYVDQKGQEKKFRSNPRLAMLLQTETITGLRIGDVCHLRLSDIIKDGRHYRLDISEQKTKKSRTFTISDDVYRMLSQWAIDHKIPSNAPLFGNKKGEPLTVRAVQKQLKIVADYLGMECVSTHSFRKTFARTAYEDSDHDIELARELLQHSSTVITQRYLGLGSKQREKALKDISDKFLLK